MIKVGKYTFTDELINDLKVLIKDSTLNKIEYGFNLYANLRDIYLLERGIICTGSECKVVLDDEFKRQIGYVPMGDFHTHMDAELEKEPGEDLSIDDLHDILSHEITCVGFRYNKLACYIVNIINDESYIQSLRNDSNIIKGYISSKTYDVTLEQQFADAWDRTFNLYLSIYYIDLNNQKIESSE